MAFSDSINGFSTAITDFAGAAGDILSAGGLRSERDAYTAAAGFSLKARDQVLKNIDIENQSTALQRASNEIKIQQQQRDLFKVAGGQRADVASAGFADSGSGLDVIRSSAMAGNLDTALLKAQGGLISKQGEINVSGYQSQAIALEAQGSSYLGQASAADAAASAAQASAGGKTAGGILNVVGSILKIFSL